MKAVRVVQSAMSTNLLMGREVRVPGSRERRDQRSPTISLCPAWPTLHSCRLPMTSSGEVGPPPLQNDPEELPHSRRHVKGGNVAGHVGRPQAKPGHE
jgi:hypothetical protein